MKAWVDLVERLEKELGSDAVKTWIKPLIIKGFDARNLYLETNDPLKITWFNEYVRPKIKQGFVNNNSQQVRVHLSFLQGSAKQPQQEKISSFQIVPDRLDPELTFENFVFSENEVVYRLLQELNLEFNPIFVYGAKHTGKTHLLMACAHMLRKRGKKAFYVRAETFTGHVVQAIRLGRMIEFRKIYRNIDALLVDNVGFFAKKNATQEEFFHTFNALHTIGKQIILSGSCPPANFENIEQRLLSRFEWGISFGLRRENPLTILTKKAKLWNLGYSDELLTYLANTFSTDPLVAMQALVLRTKNAQSLNIERAKEFLQDFRAKAQANSLNTETIIEKVATHFGITVDDILSKSQTKEHAQARKLAMFFCREILKLPFQKIGKIFARDHSTVMSSVQQVQKNIQDKKVPKALLEEFCVGL